MAALTVIEQEPERVTRLAAVSARLAAACDVAREPGAVVPVPMPDARAAVTAAERCAAQGLWVGCFRPPSVPDGISRLRLTARATIDDATLDHACAVLAEALDH